MTPYPFAFYVELTQIAKRSTLVGVGRLLYSELDRIKALGCTLCWAALQSVNERDEHFDFPLIFDVC